MFASLSRGSSKLNCPYVCVSCLSDLTGTRSLLSKRLSRCYVSHATDGTATAADAEQADASTTMSSARESKKKFGRLPSSGGSRKVARRSSLPKNTLIALRASLMTEDLENKESSARMRGSRRGKKITSKSKYKKQLNTPERDTVPNGSAKETSKTDPKKDLSKSKGKKKKLVEHDAEDRATELVMDGLEKGKKPSRDRKSKVDEGPVKISRVLARKRYLGKKDIESYLRDLEKAPARKRLVQIIQDGKLSDEDEIKAIKLLRKSMVTKIYSESNIKTAMLQSSPSALANSDKIVPAKKSRNPKAATGRKSDASTLKTGPMKEGPGYEIKSVEADSLKLTPLLRKQPPVPRLSYGLERVLFNPGVYQLQDPRSRVYNFDPYLEKIMPVDEFDFNALKEYITSSRDNTLLSAAIAENKKYTGSTSSTTSALAHFHFLLSQWRAVNTETISRKFPVEYETFTALQRGPSAIFLRWRNGVYAIDADKEFDTANILSMLGKSMEKLLTLPTEDFEKYRKENSDQISQEARDDVESFHYTTIGDFLLRSQLDAHDPRLPGTGMFDLKTRAVVSIRMDTKEYEKGTGYEIRSMHGEWESYEREYYDMIRAAFLKYSLQVRMGRMDGIFVAFHNTERIFGFQYISLSEMDLALHGTRDTTLGDAEFKLSLELLNQALDRATTQFPERSLRIHFETRGGTSDTPFMYMFAEPLEETQIQAIQESNKDAIKEFEERVLGIEKSSEELLAEENTTEEMRLAVEKKAAEDQKKIDWETLQAKVQESMDNDELGVEATKLLETYRKDGDESMSAAEAKQQLEMLLFGTPLDDGSENDDEDDDEAVEENISEYDEEVEADEGKDDEEDDEVEVESDGTEDAGERDEVDVKGKSEALDHQHNTPGTEAEGVMSDTKLDEVAANGPNLSTSNNSFIQEGQSTIATKSIVDSTDFNLLENAATEESPRMSSDGLLERPEQPAEPPSLLAMTLTIRNKVNNQYVVRPGKLRSSDKWTVEYAFAEISSSRRAASLYEAAKKRRKKALSNSTDRAKDAWNNRYIETLRNLSREGRKWRQGQNKIDASNGVKLLEVRNGTTMNEKDMDVWSVKEKNSE